VAIAGTIVPASGATVSDFTTCVSSLKETGVKVEEAVKACTKVASLAVKAATRLANEAADATKASRPLIVGYGRYGYSDYYRSSYGYSRSMVRRTIVRRAPPARHAPVRSPRTRR
jgi:hypothetical protein